jgi:hypothetical protein
MTRHPALFRFDVWPAGAFRVTVGANAGDGLEDPAAAVPGDVYSLSRTAERTVLAISDATAAQHPAVAEGSGIGRPGERLAITASARLMGPDARMVEILLLDIGGAPLLLPLAELRPGADYELLDCDAAAAPARFADIASLSFFGGTRLTLSDGRQAAVEDLRPGDRLLTRFHGAREIRWIGHRIRPATGAGAPVLIAAGTLNAARDLRLMPQHRLYVWQRRDEIGAGRAELLVPAGALVNGDTVRREGGGHADTYRLVLDRHEIVFAEGIAVDSMRAAGPFAGPTPAPAPSDLAGLEIGADALGPDGAQRLSRASRGET